MDVIHVPELPVIKHKSELFRPGFLSMTIIGKSGCGKTRMLTSILPGISDSIRTVLIATCVHNVPYHLAIQDYFSRKGVFCNIGHTPEGMRAAVEMLEQIKQVTLAKQGLLIFDDFNDGHATGPYWAFVIHAFTKLRNSGWNFVIISQNPTFIPPIVRNCTTVRVLFNCNSRSALTTFTQDVRDRLPDRAAYDTLLEYIARVKYSYLLIREDPFEICAGKLTNYRPVMTEDSVIIPTLGELKAEMGVSTKAELDEVSRQLQLDAGNTASQLDKSGKGRR